MLEHHKTMIKMAKGFRGRAKNCFELAANRVEKALQHAYVGRKLRKREFRELWIQQVRQLLLCFTGHRSLGDS
jgi:large subunit ribosomal protein L20